MKPRILLLPHNRWCLEWPLTGRKSHTVPYDHPIIWEESWYAQTDYFGQAIVAKLSDMDAAEVVDRTANKVLVLSGNYLKVPDERA